MQIQEQLVGILLLIEKCKLPTKCRVDLWNLQSTFFISACQVKFTEQLSELAHYVIRSLLLIR